MLKYSLSILLVALALLALWPPASHALQAPLARATFTPAPPTRPPDPHATSAPAPTPSAAYPPPAYPAPETRHAPETLADAWEDVFGSR